MSAYKSIKNLTKFNFFKKLDVLLYVVNVHPIIKLTIAQLCYCWFYNRVCVIFHY